MYRRLGLSILPGALAILPGVAYCDSPSATSDTELPAVVVSEKSINTEGTASSGYRYSKSFMGPLGERSLADTPYSIQSVSSELLRNHGADTYSEAVKYLPSTYVEGHFGLEFGPPVVRGLQGDDNAQSVHIDGLNVRADTALPIELYEKLDILYGPAANLYGPSPAAGTINATLKRPTDTPLREIGFAYSNRNNLAARTDLAGRFGSSDRFGFRLNLLQADGEGSTESSNLRRSLQGLALDYRANSTLLEILASHYDFRAIALESHKGLMPSIAIRISSSQAARLRF